jgi:FkbM family methyltransferase
MSMKNMLAEEIDWSSPLTYLPLLPALAILYRIYRRTLGKKRASSLRYKNYVTLPNGMKVESHQKGETEFLYKEVWEQREYAHKKFTCYDQPNAVIFDVGANIGMFSMFAAKECEPNNITIHCFEPIPQIHSICQSNVKKHTSNAKSTVHRLGLSNKKGEATFNFHPNFSLHSSGVDEFEKRRTERLRNDLPALLSDMEEKNKVPWWVQCLPRCCVLRMGSCMISKLTESIKVTVQLETVSSVIRRYNVDRIDLLKIDVEGCEEMVLDGIHKDDWSLIQHVTLEVEDFATCKRVRELLESKGFTVDSEASERKANARVSSEVSQIWAWRE